MVLKNSYKRRHLFSFFHNSPFTHPPFQSHFPMILLSFQSLLSAALTLLVISGAAGRSIVDPSVVSGRDAGALQSLATSTANGILSFWETLNKSPASGFDKRLIRIPTKPQGTSSSTPSGNFQKTSPIPATSLERLTKGLMTSVTSSVLENGNKKPFRELGSAIANGLTAKGILEVANDIEKIPQAPQDRGVKDTFQETKRSSSRSLAIPTFYYANSITTMTIRPNLASLINSLVKQQITKPVPTSTTSFNVLSFRRALQSARRRESSIYRRDELPTQTPSPLAPSPTDPQPESEQPPVTAAPTTLSTLYRN